MGSTIDKLNWQYGFANGIKYTGDRLQLDENGNLLEVKEWDGVYR